jgi:hypothetical protein
MSLTEKQIEEYRNKLRDRTYMKKAIELVKDVKEDKNGV